MKRLPNWIWHRFWLILSLSHYMNYTVHGITLMTHWFNSLKVFQHNLSAKRSSVWSKISKERENPWISMKNQEKNPITQEGWWMSFVHHLCQQKNMSWHFSRIFAPIRKSTKIIHEDPKLSYGIWFHKYSPPYIHVNLLFRGNIN